MNENPGGTPNPLNTPPAMGPKPEGGILDANPAELTQDVDTVLADAARSAQATTNSVPAPEAVAAVRSGMTPEPSTAPSTAPQAEASVEPAPVTSIPVSSLDPTGRVMEQANVATESAPKRKRTGLVFGIIGILLLIGGIVAAVVAVMLVTNKPDPVLSAMQKIMSGNSPKNVAVDGDIDILVNSATSPIKRINIDLNSNTIVGSMINTSSAVLTLTDSDNNDYSAEFDELYAANGDLYFKIQGAKELLEDENFVDLFVSDYNNSTTVTDCAGDATGTTDCATVQSTEAPITVLGSGTVNPLLEVIKSIDGVWLRMSTDQISAMGGSLPTSTVSCVTNMVEDLNKNSNSAIQIYNKYPFISSTDKNVMISSKQNPVYQIFIDSENFTDYINAMNNTELSKTLYSCMGWSNNVAVTEADVAKVVNAMPKVYAEINSNNDFSRLYFEADISNGAATVTADLGFSYPTNVNVSEPVEYTDYQSFIQTLFTTMYSNVETSSAQADTAN